MRIILLFFILIGFSLNAQLPKKASKLIGEWEYSKGSGHDHWHESDGVLYGNSHSLNSGDTINVEEMTILIKDNVLFHEIVVRNENITEILHYEAPNAKKLYFINSKSDISNSISYSFGFLNRNKLIIKMKFGSNRDKTKLILYKIKE